MNPSGLITLEIDGLRPGEVERLRSILHKLIVRGVLVIKPGRMVIDFDDQGVVSCVQIETRLKNQDGSVTETQKRYREVDMRGKMVDKSVASTTAHVRM